MEEGPGWCSAADSADRRDGEAGGGGQSRGCRARGADSDRPGPGAGGADGAASAQPPPGAARPRRRPRAARSPQPTPGLLKPEGALGPGAARQPPAAARRAVLREGGVRGIGERERRGGEGWSGKEEPLRGRCIAKPATARAERSSSSRDIASLLQRGFDRSA
ncbi:unnamed protein product [Bubo scandiacus]